MNEGLESFRSSSAAGGAFGSGCGGMTLVEVVIAVALTAVMCLGLMSVGVKARKYAEHNRFATEARSLAQEKIEEMVGRGFDGLGGWTGLNSDTNASSVYEAYSYVRQPRIVWHAATGVVTQEAASAYVEAHVDITYWSPLLDRATTDTYSTLIY